MGRTSRQDSAAEGASVTKLGGVRPSDLSVDIDQRDVGKLGQTLTPIIANLDLPAGLSPERSPFATAPVFLLHGADDSVVPASEMLSLARKLRNTTNVRAFASRLVTHAEANRGAALAELWGLSGFWQALLAQ